MTLCTHPSCPFEGAHKLRDGRHVCTAHLSVVSADTQLRPTTDSERISLAWRKRQKPPTLLGRMLGRWL